MSGTKHDQEKPRIDLVMPGYILLVAKVLTFGAKKYEAFNWTKGIYVSRLYSACQRHLLAFMSGEDIDGESGISHLGHAACNIMFIWWTVKNRPDFDDRFKGGEG